MFPFLLLFVSIFHAAQPRQLLLIKEKSAYEKTVSLDSNKKMELVSIRIPSIKIDLRYATDSNFTKQALYPQSLAFLRKIVLDSLAKAQAHFNRLGYGILIWDAYRPYRVTKKMYEMYPNKIYLSPPSKGSRHNRGCAIDLTLVALRTGRPLAMPTDFDSFSPLAFPKAALQDKEALRNRDLLIRVMELYGFRVSLSEWWHFDFLSWRRYEILDLPFATFSP